MILLVPPQISDVQKQVKESLERNGFTRFKEIEPKAGFRRFELS